MDDEFPDRSKEVAEARRLDALRAAEAAEKERQAQLAIEASKQAYTAPQRPTGTCEDWMRAAGIVDMASAYQLIMRESGCNPNSVNPYSGACGIGQQLPCGKWPHVWNDPIGGMIDMQAYVFGRYGSWATALNHSLVHNWY